MADSFKKKREMHYDVLRIAAAFSVVMLHCASQFWYTLDVFSKEWVIANSYDAAFRFGVPIFVMISGALFLDEKYELNIRRLFRHNILRLAILYVVWSFIYGLWDCRNYDLQAAGIKPVLREILYGRYHLWFLPMLAGIYVLLPVLKEWLENAQKKTVEYFLGLFFVLQICSETLRALTVTDEIHLILDLGNVELVCSYVGYFVWGYYLSHLGIGTKLKKLFYITTVPAVLCNILLGNYLAQKAGTPVGVIYDSYGLFTFIIVTALYLFATNSMEGCSPKERTVKWIGEVSADTLGVYLLHIWMIEFLESVGIHNMLLPNIVGIPLHAVCVFGICTLAAALIRRIPVVGKYIC